MLLIHKNRFCNDIGVTSFKISSTGHYRAMYGMRSRIGYISIPRYITIYSSPLMFYAFMW